MNQELEESFQRGMLRSPKNLGLVVNNITNSCRRISPFLDRMKYEMIYITYYLDDNLHHHFSAWPYAANVIFWCDMHYYWNGDDLHFKISSSNGVKDDDFLSLTKTGHDRTKYTWRIDDITGPEILGEDYVYHTMLIAYNYYFSGMYINSCKHSRKTKTT